MVAVAGLIRGFTGFGFSIAAVPLLSLVLPPAQAIPIVLLLQLLVSLSGLRGAMRLCDWRSIRWLALGAAIATPLGSLGLAHVPPAPMRLAVAAVVLLAVAVLAFGSRLRVMPGRAGVLSFGIVSGLFNGFAGMPGPPVIAFYMASPIETPVARASMIVLFLSTAVFGLAPVAALGLIGWPAVVASLAAFPVVWAASALGARLFSRSQPRHYRLVALALLVLTALLAMARAGVDLLGP